MELSKKAETPQMFNRIAGRYDLINKVLSFGFDYFWRARMVSMLPKQKNLSVLDLAAGTGDQTIALLRSPYVSSVVALDPSVEMLRIAQKKVENRAVRKSVEFEVAHAEQMPFQQATFDVATMSFGIRNVPDIQDVLKEIHRVLKPAGHVYILEFSLPRNFIIRFFNKMYLRTVVPLVGGFLSGSREAYAYLDKSIEAFPYGDDFCKELQQAGFSSTSYFSIWLGIVTIYIAQR